MGIDGCVGTRESCLGLLASGRVGVIRWIDFSQTPPVRTARLHLGR